jgi:hypothetical protein
VAADHISQTPVMDAARTTNLNHDPLIASQPGAVVVGRVDGRGIAGGRPAAAYR